MRHGPSTKVAAEQIAALVRENKHREAVKQLRQIGFDQRRASVLTNLKQLLNAHDRELFWRHWTEAQGERRAEH